MHINYFFNFIYLIFLVCKCKQFFMISEEIYIIYILLNKNIIEI